jgi:hypothetical protein
VKAVYSASDIQNLRQQLNALQLITGTSGRRGDDDRELWIIRRFINLYDFGETLGPFHLLHTDRPDFLLFFGERVMGIEVTEAISQALARALAAAEQYSGTIDFTEFARDSGKLAALRKTDFETQIEMSRTRLSRGWESNEPERLVADLFLDAVARKSDSRLGYSVMRPEHHFAVVVYDRSYAPSVDYELVTNLCRDATQPVIDFDGCFLLTADGGQLFSFP